MFVENTSVHRQEYSTKMLLLVLLIKMSTINLKLDYIYTSLHSPLSFRIDVRLEDSFYSYGYRLVVT